MITRKSLADEVAGQLQQQIVQGKYKEGDQLPIEPALMTFFGVGRSTIREAIKLLVNSGFLRVQQGLGTFVADASGLKEPLSQRLKRVDKADMDEVRQLLELKTAEKAALLRTEADIKKITRYFEKRKKAAAENNLPACIEADMQFHIAIAEAAKNEILADLYKTFSLHLKERFSHAFTNTDEFLATVHTHEQLLKSIIAKDAKKAVYWVQKIVSNATS